MYSLKVVNILTFTYTYLINFTTCLSVYSFSYLRFYCSLTTSHVQAVYELLNLAPWCTLWNLALTSVSHMLAPAPLFAGSVAYKWRAFSSYLLNMCYVGLYKEAYKASLAYPIVANCFAALLETCHINNWSRVSFSGYSWRAWWASGHGISNSLFRNVLNTSHISGSTSGRAGGSTLPSIMGSWRNLHRVRVIACSCRLTRGV